MRGIDMIMIESVPRELPWTNKQVALREKMTVRDLDFYYGNSLALKAETLPPLRSQRDCPSPNRGIR